MRYSKLVMSLFVAALVAGCGVDTVRLQKAEHATAKKADDVEIFYEKKPEREYTEIALMTAGTGTFQDILEGFRRRAAQLGADAVVVSSVVTQEKKTMAMASTVVGVIPIPMTLTIHTAEAKAVIWKAAVITVK